MPILVCMSGTRVRRRRAPAHGTTVVPHPRSAQSTDPITAIFAVIADRERRRFSGSGIRIGSSDVVHAVEHVDWFGDTSIPAPSCHTGFSMKLDRMHPARGEITCRNCRRVRGLAPASSGHGAQMTIFELPDAA